MSGRYNDYQGSSRSTRDDSRLSKERHERKRSRSRSPRRRHSPKGRYTRSPSSKAPRHSSDRRDKYRRDHEEKHDSKRSHSSEEEVPAPPPPPRITKISIGFNKPKAPIKMSLSGPTKPSVSKPTVASVFAADDDDEPEQMPAEAKMRMRNIGRETPTSAGPNSFGKTKQGFCDAKKVFEKNLKQALETADKPTPKMKFPQTIYKIGP